jgi:predicted RNase H-like HicB family nuclease
MRYSVVIEKGERNYSAYLPDVPGCIATGHTPAATLKRLSKALEMHFAGMREDGLPIPEPTTRVDYISLEVEKEYGL